MQISISRHFKNIRALCGGLTQRQLAEATSIPIREIRDIESGKKDHIPIYIAHKLAEYSNLKISWILDGKYQYHSDEKECQKNNGENTIDELSVDSTAIEVQHMELVRLFSDKPTARDATFDLWTIESYDEKTFLEVTSYIRGIRKGLEKSLHGVVSDQEKI